MSKENIKLVVKKMKQPQQISARLTRGKHLAQIVANLAGLLAISGNVDLLEGFIDSALTELVEVESAEKPADIPSTSDLVIDGSSDKTIEHSSRKSTTIVEDESEVVQK